MLKNVSKLSRELGVVGKTLDGKWLKAGNRYSETILSTYTKYEFSQNKILKINNREVLTNVSLKYILYNYAV